MGRALLQPMDSEGVCGGEAGLGETELGMWGLSSSGFLSFFPSSSFYICIGESPYDSTGKSFLQLIWLLHETKLMLPHRGWVRPTSQVERALD